MSTRRYETVCTVYYGVWGLQICTLHRNVISVKTLFVLLQLRALPSFLVRHFYVLHFHVLHFHVLQFPVLQFRVHAISCRANWSVIFMSCNFMPCNFDGPSFSVNPSSLPLSHKEAAIPQPSVVTELFQVVTFVVKRSEMRTNWTHELHFLFPTCDFF